MESKTHRKEIEHLEAPLSADWKEYERIVAWVEESIAGTNATIIQNARISGVTNQKRQVDVLVRIPYVDGDLLILIECRARSRVSDITWIEHLKTKRERLKAAKVIAISNKPLSSEAMEAICDYGMDFRLLADIGRETALSVLGAYKITIMSWHFHGVKEVAVDYDDNEVAAAGLQPGLNLKFDEDSGWIRFGTQLELLTAVSIAVFAFEKEDPPRDVGLHEITMKIQRNPGGVLAAVSGDLEVPMKALSIVGAFEYRETQLLNVTAAKYKIGSENSRVVMKHRHEVLGTIFETRSLIELGRFALHKLDMGIETKDDKSYPMLLSYQLNLSMQCSSEHREV